MVGKIFAVAVGGAVGSVLRYLVAGWGQRLVTGLFPVGTLLVNVTGCFVIGFLAPALSGPLLVREELRVAILIGLLGGFTTFSAFGWETLSLAANGRAGWAAANILLSNAFGLLAAWIGWRLARAAFGA